jgi:hypothetical protein
VLIVILFTLGGLAGASLLALLQVRARVKETTALAAVTSRIGVVMAEGLGAPATLPDAVSLIVPDAADWALIHILADHGGVSRAVAPRDPAIQADIERIHARIAFHQDMPAPPR